MLSLERPEVNRQAYKTFRQTIKETLKSRVQIKNEFDNQFACIAKSTATTFEALNAALRDDLNIKVVR